MNLHMPRAGRRRILGTAAKLEAECIEVDASVREQLRGARALIIPASSCTFFLKFPRFFVVQEKGDP